MKKPIYKIGDVLIVFAKFAHEFLDIRNDDGQDIKYVQVLIKEAVFIGIDYRDWQYFVAPSLDDTGEGMYVDQETLKENVLKKL